MECHRCAYEYLHHTQVRRERKKGGKKVRHRQPLAVAPCELSDALRHVQRGQHLLKDGPLHIGPSQVGFLQVAARQVTVLQVRETALLVNSGVFKSSFFWKLYQSGSFNAAVKG